MEENRINNHRNVDSKQLQSQEHDKIQKFENELETPLQHHNRRQESKTPLQHHNDHEERNERMNETEIPGHITIDLEEGVGDKEER